MSELLQLAERFGLDPTALAAMVSAILLLIATLKKFIPILQGKVTLAVSGGLSVLAGLSVGYNAGVVPVVMASVIIFIGANGAFELIKKAGGSS